jgi:hypothetical protein
MAINPNGRLYCLPQNFRLGLFIAYDHGKHPSLFWFGKNYGRKRFYNRGSRKQFQG